MHFAETFTMIQNDLVLYYTIVGVLGLCVGSFLNVVIYRIPLMQTHDELNLLTPRSHCPHCKVTINWTANIPLLSYLTLRGKSMCCQRKISARYPLVELSCTIILLFNAAHFGVSPQFAAASMLCAGLLTLFFIDIEQRLLPDDITLPMIWLGLFVNLFNCFTTLDAAVIGAIAGYLILWSVGWIYKLVRGIEGIGYGDYKLLAIFGAWLGWQQLPQIILLSSLAGVVYCSIRMLLRKQHYSDEIAFGPFLILAGGVSLYLGGHLCSLLV